MPLSDMESTWDVMKDPFNVDHYYDLKQAYLQLLSYEMEEATLELIARNNDLPDFPPIAAVQEELPALTPLDDTTAAEISNTQTRPKEIPVIAEAQPNLSVPATNLSENTWDYFSFNNPGYPRLSGTSQAITLLPDRRYNAAQAIFYKEAVSPPFAVKFEYAISHEGESFSKGGARPGAGLVFMFMKNPAAYAGLNNPQGDPNAAYQQSAQQTRAPDRQTPDGENRGFIMDGVGYGVHFSLYGEQTIDLKDGNGKLLASYRFDERKDRGCRPSIATASGEASRSTSPIRL